MWKILDFEIQICVQDFLQKDGFIFILISLQLIWIQTWKDFLRNFIIFLACKSKYFVY